jgi:hypothetical protein
MARNCLASGEAAALQALEKDETNVENTPCESEWAYDRESIDLGELNLHELLGCEGQH